MDKEPHASDLYHDGNERDIESKQDDSVAESQAIIQDDDIDESAVKVLPGTGGPDDVGDIEMDEVDVTDYNRDGKV